jgi:1-acyl-sn-glycerol-3-phosphate acyltransferase
MSSSSTWSRRSRTIPRTLALAAFAALFAPLLFASAIVVDVVRFALTRRPFMATRFVAFFCVYFWGQAAGLLALTWAAWGGDAMLSRTALVQRAWTALLFATVRWLFRLRFVVDGDGCVRPGPVIVLSRHTSIIDTLLPTTFLTRRHDLLLRWVLKRELLADPCLDVAGNRLPNHFVARDGVDSERELAAIRTLSSTMPPEQGCILFPEGTRLTPSRRARALEALAQSPLLPLAQSLRHCLPPRLGGTFALLDGAPDADVVVFAHTGLEGFAYVGDLWSGALVGSTVQVGVWRIARQEIPVEPDARARWLYGVWGDVDDWVEAVRSRAQPPARPTTIAPPNVAAGR